MSILQEFFIILIKSNSFELIRMYLSDTAIKDDILLTEFLLLLPMKYQIRI